MIGGTIGMGYYRLPGFIFQVCHSNAPVYAMHENVCSTIAQFLAFGKPFLAIIKPVPTWDSDLVPVSGPQSSALGRQSPVASRRRQSSVLSGYARRV